ncbi:WbqC family protein [Geoglobus ahangari]|nr:WbqC family protein [Geoglobus ahangari]
MKAVILQPMYLPWIGYFGLIDLADIFVFYDDVQFVERSWQRRNRIKMPNGKWIWLSVPVIKKFGQKINEVKVNNGVEWSKRHWHSIVHAYRKAPYFKEYETLFRHVYSVSWDYLVDLDIFLIKEISKILGIDTRFVLSSELNVSGGKTDRLINILTEIGADEYISGPAAREYIEPIKFKKSGIKLYWFEFNHPVYPQLYGEFIPYLSVIDLLFNVGPKAIDYIREGAEDSLVLDERTI